MHAEELFESVKHIVEESYKLEHIKEAHNIFDSLNDLLNENADLMPELMTRLDTKIKRVLYVELNNRGNSIAKKIKLL